MISALDSHSHDISRTIIAVLDAISNLWFLETIICLPDSTTPLSPIIRNNPKFYPFFKHAKGAIDGTHVPAHIRARYRDREGNITHNYIAACTFEMIFCYILAGWEGSAADSYLFEKARESTFAVPEGCYYLADAGFPSCDVLLVPYREVWYHLREWGNANQRSWVYFTFWNYYWSWHY